MYLIKKTHTFIGVGEFLYESYYLKTNENLKSIISTIFIFYIAILNFYTCLILKKGLLQLVSSCDVIKK